MKTSRSSALYALLAAALYALNAPCAKLLLSHLTPMLLAALLYLGAGIGMFGIGLIRNAYGLSREAQLSRRDLPYTLGMITLDIAAPILLIFGLRLTTASNASQLNNFEIVATSLIALLVFHERISRRLWIAIGVVTLASMMLSFEDISSLSFSMGSLLILLACGCWGLENNCTRMLSAKDPLQVVVIKGVGSGLGALLIAFVAGERITTWHYVPLAILLGFISYGLSIYFYVRAQRYLGAARTQRVLRDCPFSGCSHINGIAQGTAKPSFPWRAHIDGIGHCAYNRGSE